MDLEVVGPRVSVDRNGTANRGGGQLVIKQGKLLVRTRDIERVLGALGAIEHIQLVDLARLRARVQLVDAQVWNVQSEQGEDLTAFFRQLESAAGRADLLRDPPRIAELVRAAATPARARVALLAALALLAYLPLRWLGGLARPVGLLIAALGVLALLLGAAAFAYRSEDGPALLKRLRPWVSWPWLIAALVASIAGSIGASDAVARAAREREQARALAEATQRAEATAAQQQQEARARRAQADTLAQELLEAVRGERYREAKTLHGRVEALTPGHPIATQVWPQLERTLSDLDERERVAAVARGITRARAVAADRLACEAAKHVADAHALLRRARPSDADYDAALRALDGLERCRKRVRSLFAQNAEESRRSMRVVAAAQVESAVRRLGYPVRATLAGRMSDVLRIEARELDAAAAQRILASSEGNDSTFEAARTLEGFTRIELRGEKVSRDVKLHPVPAEALVAPTLEQFGLASPLTLQDAGQ